MLARTIPPHTFAVRPAPFPDRTGWTLMALGACAILLGVVRMAVEDTAGGLFLPYGSGLVLLLVGAASASILRRPTLVSFSLALTQRVSWTALALLGIFAFGLFLRTYQLGDLPVGVWFDEGLIGLEAARIRDEPGFRPLYSHGTTSPAAYIYAVALSLTAFGHTVEGLRLVSALSGALTVPLWFLLLRQGFSTRSALAGALLMAVCRWDLTFSRLAMQGITTPLFEVATLGLLLTALRRGSLALAVLAGVALGLGLAFYVAFLAFLLVIGGYLTARLLRERGFWSQARVTLAAFAAAALLAGLPVLTFAVLHPETFWGRVFQASAANRADTGSLVATLAETTTKHLLMFHREGDHNGRHNLPGAPMLDPLTGALLALGLGWSLRHLRQPFSLLGLLWLGVMLLPGILSLPFEAPQGLRSIGALPAVLLFAVIGLDRLWQAADAVLGPARRRLVTVLVCGALALSAAYNLDTYFRRQAQDYDAWAAHSTAETIIGKRLAQLDPDRWDVYLSGLYQGHPTLQFLLGPRPPGQTFVAARDLPLRSAQEGVLLFFEPREDYAFHLVRRFYSEAPCETVTVRPGATPPLMYACTVPASMIRAMQGLEHSITVRQGQKAEFVSTGEEAVSLQWGAGEALSVPFTTAWTGAVHAPISGVYGLRTEGDASLTVTIDGSRILESPDGGETPVELAQGLHSFEVTSQVTAPQGALRLLWRPPGATWQPLPAAQTFRPPVQAVGLTGSYYANPDWRGPPAFRRVDPALSLYFHLLPLARPYTVEWNGTLRVDRPGRYRLAVRASSTATLFLNETPEVEVTAPGQQREHEVELTQGTYRVRVRFRDQDSYSHVYLMWARPGGTLEPIPAEALRPW